MKVFSRKSFGRIVLSFFIACSVSFVSPAALFAQSETDSTEYDSDWYYGKLIKSVSFKGLVNTDKSDLEGITNSYIGKRFSDEVFSDLVDRIYALDLFDEVNPQALPGDSKRNTVSVVFSVKEKPSVRRITFQGNNQVRTAELKDAISIKEKDVFVGDRLLADERAIRSLYIEKGFTNVKVSSSSRETEKGVEVSFVVDEGRSTVISEIKFSGNKIYSEKTLRKQIKLKKVSKLGVISKGAYQDSTLEADKVAIQQYYMDGGYMDAVVLNVGKEISVNEKKNRDEMTITFYIQEGSQYKYTGVEFVGNQIFDDEKLNSMMKIKVGDVFSQTKVMGSFSSIADLYYENGYTSNRFEPIVSKNAEDKTVFYTLKISESVRSHVESVSIKGNSKTKDYVIKREIPIEDGDIFSKTKITTGLRNLYNLQYFSAVVPEIVPGSEENLVNLVFSVEEQSTTSIEFGVTFSGVSDPDDLPFALFAKWQDSNLRGTGKSLSVSTSIATSSQSISMSLSENWLFGLPVSASVSTSFAHSSLSALRLSVDEYGNVDDDSYYMDYEQWKWSLGFSLGRRWTPDFAIISTAAGITGSLKNNIYDEDLWIPLDTSVSEYANDWGWQNSVWTSFSIDGRNINYDPSSGWFFSEKLTWYGLTPIETEYFLRTDSKLEKYFTLVDLPVTESWNFKVVLAGYTGLSMLFPAFDTGIGDTSKLYIDGMFNGRGWTSIYNDVRGKAMLSSNVELRMPVVSGILAIDWFGDAAVIKDEPRDLFQSLSVEDFYFSTGPGIRFTIPQFPLRLLFANTFQIVDGNVEWDSKWKFVLSFCITNK